MKKENKIDLSQVRTDCVEYVV